jgi:hypothetical protein
MPMSGSSGTKPLVRLPGPGRRRDPSHLACLDKLIMRAKVLEAKWGAKAGVAERPPLGLFADLQVFHDGWQAVAWR